MIYRHTQFPGLSLALAFISYGCGILFNRAYPDPHNGNWLYIGFFGLVLAAILSVGLCLGCLIVASRLASRSKLHVFYAVMSGILGLLSLLALIPCMVYVVVGFPVTIPAALASMSWVYLACHVRKNLIVTRHP